MLAHDRRKPFIRLYDTGVTPLRALAADPRLSYRLCVPRNYDPAGSSRHPLLVAMHGTWREDLATPFQPFCEDTGAILLAPVIPGSLAIPHDLDAYKFLRFHDVAVDRLLLAMVAEVASRYRLHDDGERFAIFGFSGGAQFAHRFAYLHPRRLLALCVGAPGLVTFLDDARPWWVGTGGMAAAFGMPGEPEALRGLPARVLVGSLDDDPTEIAIREGEHDWMPGVNDAGRTRGERGAALATNWRAAGLAAECQIVPGIGHDPDALARAAFPFLRDVLAGRCEGEAC